MNEFNKEMWDILTDEQKHTLRDAFYNKILSTIKSADMTKSVKIVLTDFIENEFIDNIYDSFDKSSIAESITNIILKVLNDKLK